MTKEAKTKMRKQNTMEEAIAASDIVLKKHRTKASQRTDAEILARLVMLDLDNHKKKIALQQQGRGINRLHRIIDRLRADREKETAIFKRNMAMLNRQFGMTTPVKITFINSEGGK